MTTPAVNRNEAATQMGAEVYLTKDGTDSFTPQGPFTVRLLTESRPASTNSPKTPSGWRDPTAWNHSSSEQTPNPGISFQFVADNHPWLIAIQYLDGYGWPTVIRHAPPIPDGLEDRAIIKALGKLKNQKVNLAQAFFEREQTVKLFVGACSKIATAVQAYRSKNPKWIWDAIVVGEGQRGAKIPQSWLELQYGWKPLMQDVQGSCDQLAANSGDKFRASVNATVGTNESYSDSIGSWIYGELILKTNVKTKVRVKVRLDYTLENPFVATLSQVGVTNPAALVWELLPYSFVVDWFSPVGNWLSAFDAALGWSFKGGSCSAISNYDERGTVVIPPKVFGGHVSVMGAAASAHWRANSFTRKVYSSSPLPRFPGIKNPISGPHIANAVALLSQVFSR